MQNNIQKEGRKKGMKKKIALKKNTLKQSRTFETDPNNTNSNILSAAKESLEAFYDEKLTCSRSLARTRREKFKIFS